MCILKPAITIVKNMAILVTENTANAIVKLCPCSPRMLFIHDDSLLNPSCKEKICIKQFFK